QSIQGRQRFLASKVQPGGIHADASSNPRKPLSKSINFMLADIQPVEVMSTDIFREKNIFVNQKKAGDAHAGKRDRYFTSSRSNTNDGDLPLRQTLEIHWKAGCWC